MTAIIFISFVASFKEKASGVLGQMQQHFQEVKLFQERHGKVQCSEFALN